MESYYSYIWARTYHGENNTRLQFFLCFVTTQVSYVSDNLELINRNKEYLNYTNPYSNNTLSVEFDITVQIYLINQTCNIEASFQHVYGHQATRSRGKNVSRSNTECRSGSTSRGISR